MALCKPVEWTELATFDYNAILDYLHRNWGHKVISNFALLTDKTIEHISCNPRVYRYTNKKMRIRRCVLSKHNSIYYIVKKDRIQIVRIYDNRRDPKKLKFY